MDTKTALLDSAEKAARKWGYDGFSYADLADDIGIRKASIHYHFPKKDDLALALMERYREKFFDSLAVIKQKHMRASDQLTAYIRLYKAALSGCDTLCLCVAFSTGRDNLSEAVLKEINTFHKFSITWLSDVFETGQLDKTIASVQKPLEEAAACLATVEGAQLIARSSKKISHFDRALAHLKSRLT